MLLGGDVVEFNSAPTLVRMWLSNASCELFSVKASFTALEWWLYLPTPKPISSSSPEWVRSAFVSPNEKKAALKNRQLKFASDDSAATVFYLFCFCWMNMSGCISGCCNQTEFLDKERKTKLTGVTGLPDRLVCLRQEERSQHLRITLKAASLWPVLKIKH